MGMPFRSKLCAPPAVHRSIKQPLLRFMNGVRNQGENGVLWYRSRLNRRPAGKAPRKSQNPNLKLQTKSTNSKKPSQAADSCGGTRVVVSRISSDRAAPRLQLLLTMERWQLIAVIPNEVRDRSEEHTSELQSLAYLVCRLL